MNEDSFFVEIDAAPKDPAPKLIFADWLEERGDKRANFIRAVVDDFKSIEELMRMAGIKSRDTRWSTVHGSGVNFKCLPFFAADCAERVLHLFEEQYPLDDRPRKAIEAARMDLEVRIVAQIAYAAAEVAANNAVTDAAQAAQAERSAAQAHTAADAAHAAAHVTVQAERAANKAARSAARAAARAAHTAAEALILSKNPLAFAAYTTDSAIYAVENATGSAQNEMAASFAAVEEEEWQLVRLCEYKLFERPIYLGELT